MKKAGSGCSRLTLLTGVADYFRFSTSAPRTDPVMGRSERTLTSKTLILQGLSEFETGPVGSSAWAVTRKSRLTDDCPETDGTEPGRSLHES